MEKFLILTHDKAEGSGSLGTFLESIAIDAQTAKLHEGDNLPEDPSNLGAIISMGGSMSVHDEYVYPFLHREKEFLMHAIEANVPVLGICLGAQLIARACHAAVTKAPVKELGWREVSITDEGKRDILFQGLSRVIQVFQWHEDAFDIPEGAKFLATSRVCPNQAFRYRNAYGLQFHIEVTRDMLSGWMEENPERDKTLRVFDRMAQDFERQAKTLYSNFLWLADICKRSDKPLRRTNRY